MWLLALNRLVIARAEALRLSVQALETPSSGVVFIP